MKTAASFCLPCTGKIKILVVEDEPTIGMMMACLLTDAGCRVEVVRDSETALRLARDGKFDLIAIDLVLPGISAFEFCGRLKQNVRLRDLPFLFVAGSADEEDRRRAFALGAVDYIIKPFYLADFVSRVLSHTGIKTSCIGFSS
jgi:DNA-binding response OmpR family regulator